MTVRFSADRPLTDEEEAEIQAMIASDPENPELTEEQIAAGRPFRDVFPELTASIERELAQRGRPKSRQTKMPVTIRLDPDLVQHYRKQGKGWQSRMNDDLRKLAGL